MKKTYIIPAIEEFKISEKQPLLADSYKRRVGGAVINSTGYKILPEDVIDMSDKGDDYNPFGGHGQGTGGDGTRSKDFDLWDDTGW